MSTIIKHIYIAKSQLFINGELAYKGENPIFVKFLKEVYKFASVKYPKYYKMDTLSKLGFIASEVLLQNYKMNATEERVGVAIGNRASTYLVDSKHQETINDKENYFPSPANFVYTLPNVMTGEICIRNGFKGENIVLIMDGFNIEQISDYINLMYQANKADIILGGYVNADEDDYEAFLFLTQKSDIEIDNKEIDKIYSKLINNKN